MGQGSAELGGQTYFAHEKSLVDDGAVVGAGSRIWAGAHIMAGATVGENCNIGENCYIESGVTVGDRVTVKNNVALYSGAVVEDDVFLGPSCVFTNVMTPRAFVSRKDEFQKTVVRRGATVGANATIVCGNTVGQYAMIGAGAVVTNDVPDYALAYGCPARLCGWVCRCGEKLRTRAITYMDCRRCGAAYRLEGDTLRVEKTGEA